MTYGRETEENIGHEQYKPKHIFKPLGLPTQNIL
jgi:hypothetical protein